MSQSKQMRPILTGLADVCDHTNRPDEAARWRAQLVYFTTNKRT
jgi:hypothetical protein